MPMLNYRAPDNGTEIDGVGVAAVVHLDGFEGESFAAVDEVQEMLAWKERGWGRHDVVGSFLGLGGILRLGSRGGGHGGCWCRDGHGG